ncbi:hypothetical protein BIW11_03565 [Tropilaelaps mercedesae]|uniref:Uncharacterized protein n=1 Tax=Tropilaelaps mercedesae TaxID=418985 RepID=A0A1V9XJ44_9ACAR|nr:hypothetical protein BIW11_03565 [Tropilaelaps mercedesae]
MHTPAPALQDLLEAFIGPDFAWEMDSLLLFDTTWIPT